MIDLLHKVTCFLRPSCRLHPLPRELERSVYQATMISQRMAAEASTARNLNIVEQVFLDTPPKLKTSEPETRDTNV